MFNYPEAKIYLVFSWVVFILILIITPLPNLENSSELTLNDKIIHFFMFGVLSFLLNWSLREVRESRPLFADTLIVSGVIIYVLLCEYIQGFIPSRTACQWDIIAGILGAIIGLTLSNLYFREEK